MPSIDRDRVTEPLHVVVGLVCDGDRVFVTRRPASAHQGGMREFPGGKLVPGEDVRHGLARELEEELGIAVRSAQPYTQVRYPYPGRAVLLDVWRVIAFDGAPHGREGQEAAWREIATLRPSEFPPADRPILRRLQLPRLYVISDAARYGPDEFKARLERALVAGVRLVQLREPTFHGETFRLYARELAILCHRYGAKLLLNADPSLVSECDADGVHLTARQLAVLGARPIAPDLLIGVSCHNGAELQRAQDIEADFAVLSPVQPTASHPRALPLGWDAFDNLTSSIHTPVYALGGLRAGDARRARQAGAIGMAMISGIWGSDDIEAAVKTALAD